MSTYTQNFTDVAELAFSDNNLLEQTGSIVRLKLQNNTGQTNTPDISASSYDTDLAEYTGGKIQQKNKRLANEIFYASYTTNQNANISEGSNVGTLQGGATVSGGALDCEAAGEYCSYVNTSNVGTNTGCVRIRVSFPFNGGPPTTSIIWADCLGAGSSNHNAFYLQYQAGTNLWLYAFNNAGASILTKNFGAFAAVEDQIYEFELNYDFSGDIRLFIDGTQQGTDGSASGTRTAVPGKLLLGTGITLGEDSYIKYYDVLHFDAVQHTANYTPDWSDVYEYDYVESTVTLPEFEYTGAGLIQLLTALTTTEANTPRYTIQIDQSGNYLYWDTSTWSTSDGTFDQSTIKTTFNTNIGSIDADETTYIQLKIHFGNGSVQMSVTTLTLTYVGQIYPITNPYIYIPATAFYMDELESFTATETATGSDAVKYLQKKDTDYIQYSSGWQSCTLTYANSNTSTEIETNKATFTTERVLYGVYIFLHSNDGTTTPSIDLLTIGYSYAGEAADTINKCIVWGISKAPGDSVSTNTVTAKLNKPVVQYKDTTLVVDKEETDTPDAGTGYWELELIETANMSEDDDKYLFTINGKEYERSVPNEQTKAFWDLV